MQNHALHFEEQAGAHRDEGVLDAPTIDFYRALFDYRQAEYGRYLNNAGMPALQASHLPIAEHGRNAILIPALRDILVPGLAPLTSLLSLHHPGLDFKTFRSALLEKSTIMDDFVDSLLDFDHSRMELLANTHKMSADETVFLIINWLSPFFILLREKHKDLIPGGSSTFLCPFCGYSPDMGVILADKEGKRFLHCGLCEHEWPYKRIACAVCGSEDAAKLEVLSPEGKSRYRLDLCRACGGYIKTVLLDKFEDTDACDLAVENLYTTHLDAAALQAGFRRP